MRLHSLYKAVLIISLSLVLPLSVRALTVSIDGATLVGLGTCSKAPSGCTDLVNYPPDGDANGLFDQLFLDPINVDTITLGGNPISQHYVFNPGNTGAGSVGFEDAFSLHRAVTVLDGSSIVGMGFLDQTGSLLVGMYEDTLTVGDGFTQIDLGSLGLLDINLAGFSETAGLDPEGDAIGSIVLRPHGAPLPPVLALLAVGLAGLGGVRHWVSRSS